MLTQEHRAAYQNDGVVRIKNAFSQEWLDEVRSSIEFGRANPGPMYLDYSKDTNPGTYCTDMWIWRENIHMKNFIFNSPAAELAGEAMEASSVALVTDNWLVREAGAVNRAPWHHDNPYFDVSGEWCVHRLSSIAVLGPACSECLKRAQYDRCYKSIARLLFYKLNVRRLDS
jgi:hypothetical protein